MKRVRPVLLLTALLTGCTQASAPAPPDASSISTEVLASPSPSPSPSPLPRLRADWVTEVNDGCLIGLKMYPSLALGADADVDTVDLGVNKFSASLAQARPGDAPADRKEAQALVAMAGPVKTQWFAIATATSAVPRAQKQQAINAARAFILEVAAIGAPACGDLAPPPA